MLVLLHVWLWNLSCIRTESEINLYKNQWIKCSHFHVLSTVRTADDVTVVHTYTQFLHKSVEHTQECSWVISTQDLPWATEVAASPAAGASWRPRSSLSTACTAWLCWLPSSCLKQHSVTMCQLSVTLCVNSVSLCLSTQCHYVCKLSVTMCVNSVSLCLSTQCHYVCQLSVTMFVNSVSLCVNSVSLCLSTQCHDVCQKVVLVSYCQFSRILE